jgi:hypothetical protein
MRKIVAFFAVFLGLAGIAMGQTDNSLIGKWILYSPSQGERDYIEVSFIEFTNNAMIVSTMDFLVPDRSQKSEFRYSSEGNNLIMNLDDEESIMMQYEINGNILHLTSEDIPMKLMRITNSNKNFIGKYICFTGSTSTLELLDESNALVMSGLSYNQQPGEYTVSGNYLFLTINCSRYVFEIIENGSVLFGRTNELKGGFIKY